jgi:hypothetical protein
MPILTALDECGCALKKISIYADLGMECPTLEKIALLSIQQCCNELEETIQSIIEMVERKL